MLATGSPPGIFDQNPPHRLGRRRKEVAATVPVLPSSTSTRPDIGLMHQRRGLQRLTRLLLGQLGGGQFPQLLYTSGKSCSAALGSPDSI